MAGSTMSRERGPHRDGRCGAAPHRLWLNSTSTSSTSARTDPELPDCGSRIVGGEGSLTSDGSLVLSVALHRRRDRHDARLQTAPPAAAPERDLPRSGARRDATRPCSVSWPPAPTTPPRRGGRWRARGRTCSRGGPCPEFSRTCARGARLPLSGWLGLSPSGGAQSSGAPFLCTRRNQLRNVSSGRAPPTDESTPG